MAWQRRADFFPDLTPLDETIRIGLASEGVTVVSDAGDAPTGGSAADSAGGAEGAPCRRRRPRFPPLLSHALRSRGGQARRRQVPARRVRLAVGHAFSTADGAPVAVTGIVQSLSDGDYRMTDGGPNGLELGWARPP